MTSPCQHGECALCNICCTGFNALFANSRFPGRYGSGLYFSATSSKSHDYAHGAERAEDEVGTGAAGGAARGGRMRALLVCEVLAGATFETQKGLPFMADAEVRGVVWCGAGGAR